MGENLSDAPKADGRGENLFEALKADGKVENLMEAPLLSFKKKTKKNRESKFIMWQCMQVAGIL